MFSFSNKFSYKFFNKINKRNVITTTKKIFARENIPYFGLFVGACALGFQTLVLHPWHDHLSEQFDQLEERIHKLDAFAQTLVIKMDEVVKLEEEVKIKELRVLDSSQEILSKIEQTEKKIKLLATSNKN
mmetsp:Transcript_23480/g.24114  ORF Transcript_23480/g.24114 Transcript_23480/m.24114 type:complete len:130 (-) Transcript_23480:466-855(-)